MSYITTYTGKHFDPIQPEPGLFDLTDISMRCRFCAAATDT